MSKTIENLKSGNYEVVDNQGVSVTQHFIECLEKEFADLEAKLKESEKKFIVANNLRKNSDEVLLNYKAKKYGLDKTIQELRKVKLSLPEKEWYYKGFENCERQMSSHIADLTLEVKELKHQLGEKEKDKQEFKTMYFHKCLEYGHLYEKFVDKCNEFELKEYDYKQTIFEKDQDKISFAIEQLEKVKELLNTDFESIISWIDPYEAGGCLNSMTYNHNNTIKIIDNQINELKEMK